MLVVLLLLCSECLTHPRVVMGWSVVCECGISWPYSFSLTVFFYHIIFCICTCFIWEMNIAETSCCLIKIKHVTSVSKVFGYYIV